MVNRSFLFISFFTRMNKFTLGMIAGMSTLTLAVPLAAQFSFAAETDGSADARTTRPAPTQECLLAMVSLEDAHLANFDAMQATHKTEMQSRRDALYTVAQIIDDTARTEALKTMHETMRAENDGQTFETPAAVETAMEAVRSACGDTMMFMGRSHGPMGMKMRGPGGPGGHTMLLEKLDMTEEELKAALDDGMSIEDLATEKGVELPQKPHGFKGGRNHFFEKPTAEPTE